MKDVDPNQPDLSEVLLHDEDLIKVIRSHLIVEQQIISFLEQALPYSESINVDKLHWTTKLDLACALGLTEEYTPALKKLNNIRNDFAHGKVVSINEKLVQDFFNTFPKSGHESLEKHFKNTNRRLGVEVEEKFTDQPFDMKFIMMVITLSQFLEAANIQVRNERRT